MLTPRKRVGKYLCYLCRTVHSTPTVGHLKARKHIFLTFRCPTVGVECTVLYKYHKYLPTRFRDVNTFFSLKKYHFYSSVFAMTHIFILFRKQENTPTGCHENTVSFCYFFENTPQKLLIFF